MDYISFLLSRDKVFVVQKTPIRFAFLHNQGIPNILQAFSPKLSRSSLVCKCGCVACCRGSDKVQALLSEGRLQPGQECTNETFSSFWIVLTWGQDYRGLFFLPEVLDRSKFIEYEIRLKYIHLG